jgi:hypothetical protein
MNNPIENVIPALVQNVLIGLIAYWSWEKFIAVSQAVQGQYRRQHLMQGANFISILQNRKVGVNDAQLRYGLYLPVVSTWRIA